MKNKEESNFQKKKIEIVCWYDKKKLLSKEVLNFLSNQIGCESFNIGWIGDGYCDYVVNNADCSFDGGDCCGNNINTQFCDECICYE